MPQGDSLPDLFCCGIALSASISCSLYVTPQYCPSPYPWSISWAREFLKMLNHNTKWMTILGCFSPSSGVETWQIKRCFLVSLTVDLKYLEQCPSHSKHSKTLGDDINYLIDCQCTVLEIERKEEDVLLLWCHVPVDVKGHEWASILDNFCWSFLKLILYKYEKVSSRSKWSAMGRSGHYKGKPCRWTK